MQHNFIKLDQQAVFLSVDSDVHRKVLNLSKLQNLTERVPL